MISRVFLLSIFPITFFYMIGSIFSWNLNPLKWSTIVVLLILSLIFLSIGGAINMINEINTDQLKKSNDFDPLIEMQMLELELFNTPKLCYRKRAKLRKKIKELEHEME